MRALKRRRNRITLAKQLTPNRRTSPIKLSYTVPIMIVGFVLAYSGLWFLLGIVLWSIGFLGSVYAVVNRLAGARAAKWAVLLIVLVFIIEVVFGQRKD